MSSEIAAEDKKEVEVAEATTTASADLTDNRADNVVKAPDSKPDTVLAAEQTRASLQSIAAADLSSKPADQAKLVRPSQDIQVASLDFSRAGNDIYGNRVANTAATIELTEAKQDKANVNKVKTQAEAEAERNVFKVSNYTGEFTGSGVVDFGVNTVAGVAKGGWGLVKGVGHAVWNPGTTLVNIKDGVGSLFTKDGLSNAYNGVTTWLGDAAFLRGAAVAGDAWGHGLFNVGTLAAGGALVRGATGFAGRTAALETAALAEVTAGTAVAANVAKLGAAAETAAAVEVAGTLSLASEGAIVANAARMAHLKPMTPKAAGADAYPGMHNMTARLDNALSTTLTREVGLLERTTLAPGQALTTEALAGAKLGLQEGVQIGRTVSDLTALKTASPELMTRLATADAKLFTSSAPRLFAEAEKGLTAAGSKLDEFTKLGLGKTARVEELGGLVKTINPAELPAIARGTQTAKALAEGELKLAGTASNVGSSITKLSAAELESAAKAAGVFERALLANSERAAATAGARVGSLPGAGIKALTEADLAVLNAGIRPLTQLISEGQAALKIGAQASPQFARAVEFAQTARTGAVLADGSAVAGTGARAATGFARTAEVLPSATTGARAAAAAEVVAPTARVLTGGAADAVHAGRIATGAADTAANAAFRGIVESNLPKIASAERVLAASVAPESRAVAQAVESLNTFKTADKLSPAKYFELARDLRNAETGLVGRSPDIAHARAVIAEQTPQVLAEARKAVLLATQGETRIALANGFVVANEAKVALKALDNPALTARVVQDLGSLQSLLIKAEGASASMQPRVMAHIESLAERISQNLASKAMGAAVAEAGHSAKISEAVTQLTKSFDTMRASYRVEQTAASSRPLFDLPVLSSVPRDLGLSNTRHFLTQGINDAYFASNSSVGRMALHPITVGFVGSALIARGIDQVSGFNNFRNSIIVNGELTGTQSFGRQANNDGSTSTRELQTAEQVRLEKLILPVDPREEQARKARLMMAQNGGLVSYDGGETVVQRLVAPAPAVAESTSTTPVIQARQVKIRSIEPQTAELTQSVSEQARPSVAAFAPSWRIAKQDQHTQRAHEARRAQTEGVPQSLAAYSNFLANAAGNVSNDGVATHRDASVIGKIDPNAAASTGISSTTNTNLAGQQGFGQQKLASVAATGANYGQVLSMPNNSTAQVSHDDKQVV